MSKTDKELTVEIVNNFITAWNSSDKTSPINSANLDDLIKSVHSTLQELPEK
ncbi:hypothetical protein HA669_001008 [Listeria monocytogenes]|nr:hypothetical protein [Listeria monocytogenes]